MEPVPGLLLATDLAGGSFFLLTITLLATSILLFMGVAWANWRFKVPVALTAVTMLVAFLHYLHASVVWAYFNDTPVIYRYIDWQLTTPLQVVTLYFFTRAVGNPTIDVFWRLLIVSVLMVLARYLGDTGLMNPTLGFLIGIVGWLYIQGEIYFGRMNEAAVASGDRAFLVGYFWVRLVVTIGWALYPLVYFIDSFAGGIATGPLNVTYNLGDLINKVLFALIILNTAVRMGTDKR